jgi:hypothetical protein
MKFDKTVNLHLESLNREIKQQQIPKWEMIPFDIVFGNLYHKNKKVSVKNDPDTLKGIRDEHYTLGNFGYDRELYIPMRGIFKDVFLYRPNSKANHLTSLKGAINVYKNQHEETFQLSVTTGTLYNNPCSRGIHAGGVTLNLRGDIAYPTKNDQMSLVDTFGYRWVNIAKYRFITESDYESIYNRVIQIFNSTWDEKSNKNGREYLSLQEKNKLVDIYLNLMAKVVEPRKERIREYLESESFHNKHSYNEMIMSNYEILKAKLCVAGKGGKDLKEVKILKRFLEYKGIPVELIGGDGTWDYGDDELGWGLDIKDDFEEID